jgi:putative intracellular protease/amidase
MATSLNGNTIAFPVAPEGVGQVELARSFFDAGKPVAVICHAPGH